MFNINIYTFNTAKKHNGTYKKCHGLKYSGADTRQECEGVRRTYHSKGTSYSHIMYEDRSLYYFRYAFHLIIHTGIIVIIIVSFFFCKYIRHEKLATADTNVGMNKTTSNCSLV